jgi:tetratricopeptide (TPR) repeat protein
LAQTFLTEHKRDKAEKYLDLSLEKFPIRNYGPSPMLLDYVRLYYKLGKKDKARALASKLLLDYQQHLKYYSTFPEKMFPAVYNGFELNAFMYRELVSDIFQQNESEEFTNKAMEEYIKYIEMFEHYLKD